MKIRLEFELKDQFELDDLIGWLCDNEFKFKDIDSQNNGGTHE